MQCCIAIHPNLEEPLFPRPRNLRPQLYHSRMGPYHDTVWTHHQSSSIFSPSTQPLIPCQYIWQTHPSCSPGNQSCHPQINRSKRYLGTTRSCRLVHWPHHRTLLISQVLHNIHQRSPRCLNSRMVPQTIPILQGNHQILSTSNIIRHSGHPIRKGQKENNPFTGLWIRYQKCICQNRLLPPTCHATPHCTNRSTPTSTSHSPSTPANACHYYPNSPHSHTSFQIHEGATNSTTNYYCHRYEGYNNSTSAHQCRRYEVDGPVLAQATVASPTPTTTPSPFPSPVPMQPLGLGLPPQLPHIVPPSPSKQQCITAIRKASRNTSLP